jgi:hypothetical protein
MKILHFRQPGDIGFLLKYLSPDDSKPCFSSGYAGPGTYGIHQVIRTKTKLFFKGNSNLKWVIPSFIWLAYKKD